MIDLTKLLAASRSFRGVRKAPAPFKMVDAAAMPKFGKPAPAAPDGAIEEPVCALADTLPAAPEPFVLSSGPETSTAVTGRDRHEGSTTPFTPARAIKDLPTISLPPAGHWHRLVRFLNRFNPFMRRGARVGNRRLIQAELSLTGVRVVRNDLKEDDLEIVPAEPNPARAQTKPLVKRPAGVPEPVRSLHQVEH